MIKQQQQQMLMQQQQQMQQQQLNFQMQSNQQNPQSHWNPSSFTGNFNPHLESAKSVKPVYSDYNMGPWKYQQMGMNPMLNPMLMNPYMMGHGMMGMMPGQGQMIPGMAMYPYMNPYQGTYGPFGPNSPYRQNRKLSDQKKAKNKKTQIQIIEYKIIKMIKKQIIFLFWVLLVKLESSQDCVLRNIFNKVNFEDQSKLQIQKYLQERDFASKVDLNDENLFDYLDVKDIKTKLNLEKLLLNFKNLNVSVQQAIFNCSLKVENVQQRCKDFFGKECVKVDEFTFVSPCPKNYELVGYSHCVLKCPSGFDSIENDPFYCRKTIRSKRSDNFENEVEIVKRNYRNVLEVEQCPEGFLSLENNLCIRVCPSGWEDFGEVCRKPFIQKRKKRDILLSI